MHRPTKLVGTIDKPFWRKKRAFRSLSGKGFLSESGRFVGRKGFVGKLSYRMVSYDMVSYDMCLWCRKRGARERDFAIIRMICVIPQRWRA